MLDSAIISVLRIYDDLERPAVSVQQRPAIRQGGNVRNFRQNQVHADINRRHDRNASSNKTQLKFPKTPEKKLKVNEDKCQAALSPDLLATDLAYYLVRKGVAFRDAHHLAGKAVAEAAERQILLSHLEVAELQKIRYLQLV